MKFIKYSIRQSKEGRFYVYVPDHLVLVKAKGLLVTLLQDGVISRNGLLGRQISKMIKKDLTSN